MLELRHYSCLAVLFCVLLTTALCRRFVTFGFYTGVSFMKYSELEKKRENVDEEDDERHK